MNTSDNALLWNPPPPPPQPKSGEPLFDFVRASDRRSIGVELRFNDERRLGR